MRYDPTRDSRRSLRLPDWDYARPGAYFVTICTEHKASLLGRRVGTRIDATPAGRMVHDTWNQLPERFPSVHLDAFVLMPDHVHGVLFLGASDSPGEAKSGGNPVLGDVIGAFKSISTHRYIAGVRDGLWPPFDGRVWQRGYFEHVVREERDLHRIRVYIAANPHVT